MKEKQEKYTLRPVHIKVTMENWEFLRHYSFNKNQTITKTITDLIEKKKGAYEKNKK